jgi:hypothetical protein
MLQGQGYQFAHHSSSTGVSNVEQQLMYVEMPIRIINAEVHLSCSWRGNWLAGPCAVAGAAVQAWSRCCCWAIVATLPEAGDVVYTQFYFKSYLFVFVQSV